ncbi:PepSY domain-containing protein [Gemmobacter lutimaris]|uniref:PepSY domain-containing protein n=1 Tax=Gemmobacter lutimaris TaxID=2306023 RepID=A0A398BQT1_9RHOB|nr:PepSY domain-containing protein [Gemmobacter lutimaris]RID92104.1 PepSY domain-containing protein [Gemmobacter lutimaris]
MSIQTPGPQAGGGNGRINPLYFAVWRWHFYAGLYVIPFLCMLAVTGLVMLWISYGAGIGAERMTVPVGATPLAPSVLQEAAEAAVPGGRAVQYVAPLASDKVAAFAVATDAGKTGVALDPYTGAVVHSFPWRAGWYDLANDIHGSLLLGTLGDRLIEAAASLGLLLVATGLYLHWPRGTGWRAALVPSVARRGRALWKSLHGVVGLWVSVLLVLFLISGLSWAGIWGEKFVQAWSTFPAEKWDNVPLSDATHASMNHGAAKEVPWGLEQTPMPASGSLAGQAAIAGPVTLDSVAAFAQALGFDRRFQINLPGSDSGVWTISHDSMSNDGPDPAADRTLHIDRYTGNVLADVRYADYSAYAKAMAWGIAFHEGDLGLWNLVLNTAFCLSVVFLAVSGLVLWWKRRPAGASRLAAPPRPEVVPQARGVLLIGLLLSMAFPMLGLTLLAVLAFDLLVLTGLPPLRRALS